MKGFRKGWIAAIIFIVRICSMELDSVCASDLASSPVIPFDSGTMEVSWRTDVAKPSAHIVLHFHGGVETVKRAFLRTELNAVLVIVNFPGSATV